MTATATITQLEEAEFKLVDAIWRLSLTEATSDLRRRCQDMLDRVRARKASLLGDNPDVLRKSDTGARRSPAEPRWFGLPAVGGEVDTLAKEARSRASEERRLAKASGRTRYRAPAHLRGSSIRLVDGRRLDIPEHGFCELAGSSGVHPGYGPHAETAAHRQLLDRGFRVMPDEPDDTMKAALRRPIVGDRGLIRFLNRHAAG